MEPAVRHLLYGCPPITVRSPVIDASVIPPLAEQESLSWPQALVQVRPDQDGVRGDFHFGESEYGRWVRIPFEVIEGSHQYQWAGLLLTLNSSANHRFRQTMHVVIGTDLTAGGAVSFTEFKQQLLANTFVAQLRPDTDKRQPDGLMRVDRLLTKSQVTRTPVE